MNLDEGSFHHNQLLPLLPHTLSSLRVHILPSYGPVAPTKLVEKGGGAKDRYFVKDFTKSVYFLIFAPTP